MAIDLFSTSVFFGNLNPRLPDVATATVIAGPNGSGKSTLTTGLEIEGKKRLIGPTPLQIGWQEEAPSNCFRSLREEKPQTYARSAITGAAIEWLRENPGDVSPPPT